VFGNGFEEAKRVRGSKVAVRKFPAWNICFQQLMILAKIFSYRKMKR